MNHIRRGVGPPLLLIHGLGGSWHSWSPILDDLAEQREVIAVDLPGHGETPPLSSAPSIGKLADTVAEFVATHDLAGVDAVGSSMGARLVLELARRGGTLGRVVSLDPGGFWNGLERQVFYGSIWLSIRIVRALQPVMAGMIESTVGRTLLLSQFSAHPWKVPARTALRELRDYASSPSFDELLRDLAYGQPQRGAPRGSLQHAVTIGWGRSDRVCFPRQADRALALFPDARLHWFDHCGHFPHWDVPRETIELVRAGTS